MKSMKTTLSCTILTCTTHH